MPSLLASKHLPLNTAQQIPLLFYYVIVTVMNTNHGNKLSPKGPVWCDTDKLRKRHCVEYISIRTPLDIHRNIVMSHECLYAYELKNFAYVSSSSRIIAFDVAEWMLINN